MDTAGEGAVEQNDCDQRSDLNLSDVLKVLDAEGPLQARADAMAAPWPQRALAQQPYVRIVEQPAPKALRFRYECEGRSAGSILGVSSTPDRKTYPTIEVGGYSGSALVVVCCVTSDEPYRPHPHNLVGNDCRNGVFRVRCDIGPESRTVSFTKLGVQCVKRKDVADALAQRERENIDPFRTGFEHRNNPQSINLNAVRLCFHVYLMNESGKYRRALPPAVSDVVYDKKAMSELLIARVSACTGSARGGLQMIILCDKVSRDEVSVVFEQRGEAGALWREQAPLEHVHKQYAIVCTVPPYRTPHLADEVKACLFLERRTDKARSNEIAFTYLPDVTYTDYLNGKKRKILDTRGIESYDRDRQAVYAAEAAVKQEPREVGRSPRQVISPQNPFYQDVRQWGMPGAGGPGVYQYGVHQLGLQDLPAVDPHSPCMQATSPLMHVQIPSPHMQAASPHMQAPSPHMQAPSPHMQAPSPHMQAPSPHMQAQSPHMQPASPEAPHMQQMHMMHSPVLMHQPMQQQMPQQQMPQQQQLAQQLPQLPAGPPVSLDHVPSGDLSLTSLLGFLGPDADLTDRINNLSTSEL